MDIMREFQRWQEMATDPVVAGELEDLARKNDSEAIKDAFYRELEFGTAGLRGVLGAGTNRMNIYTVAKATQGLANYLNTTSDEPSVAIARDSRNRGEVFVRVAAGVLAANGITAYLYPRIQPTPALSFAVRDLGCDAGINMTASHNPAEYNGYKAYGSDGCQITSQAATAIQNAIDGIDVFDDVSCMDFDEALAAGKAQWIGEDTLDRFIDAVYAEQVTDPDAADEHLKVVYTPLNGTGLECVTRILNRVGIDDIDVVAEQAEPDGNFPTCPYPNPEIREALQKGIDRCEEVHPDLLLATDPDADRVGIAVKNDADYVLLTGNETGILLLDYIAGMRAKCGTLPANGVAVSTIVSTVMIDDLAANYGFELRRCLTGFKYIGEIIAQLEADGEEDRFLFGFEESYGYLSGTHVRDKDAINASMLICQMAQHYKHLGMNLAQAMDALYQKYGYYRNRTISLSFAGAAGAQKMSELMSGLREDTPKTLADMPVEQVVDYQKGGSGLPAANVIEFRLPNTNKIIFRPSGTEPKIKAYLFAKGDCAAKADETLDALEAAARGLLS